MKSFFKPNFSLFEWILLSLSLGIMFSLPNVTWIGYIAFAAFCAVVILTNSAIWNKLSKDKYKVRVHYAFTGTSSNGTGTATVTLKQRWKHNMRSDLEEAIKNDNGFDSCTIKQVETLYDIERI